MDKLWYIQTMEYYSALTRNKPSSYEKTWRNLKCILLNERSQSEKITYCVIPTIRHFGKRQNSGNSKKDQWLPGFGSKNKR